MKLMPTNLQRSHGMSLMIWILFGCLVMAVIDAATWTYPIKAIFKIVVFLGIPALWSLRHPNWPKASILLSKRKHRLVLGLLFLGEVGILFGLVLLALPFLDTSMIEGILRENFAGRPVVFFGVTMYIVVINAALEEWYFRGLAFLRLKHLMGKAPALFFSSVAFAAYHLALMAPLFPFPLFSVFIVGLVGVGALLCWIDDVTDSLLPSFIIHAGANLALNLIAMRLLGFF